MAYVAKFVQLDKHMDSSKWDKLRLFFHILKIGESHLVDEANNLLKFREFLLAKFKVPEQAISILSYMLHKIEVMGSDELGSAEIGSIITGNECSVHSELKYAALLVEICKCLRKDDYENLLCISCEQSCLDLAGDKINSREDLMLKLHHGSKISSCNVEFFSDWLDKLGRTDIGDIVRGYAKDLSATKHSGSISVEQERTETEDTPGIDSRVAIIALNVGVSDGELKRRILKDDIDNIFKLKHFDELSLLPASEPSSLKALHTWHGNEGDKATYWGLVEKCILCEKLEMGEQICRMAKVTLYCSPRTEYQETAAAIPEGCRPGAAPKENLWDYTSITELKVFFMNPDTLCVPNRRWLCGHNGLEQMNTENILEWATRAWNNHCYESYPRICMKAALKIKGSHIRIKFAEESNSNVCWSRIGKDAQNFQDKETMFLDLFNLHQQMQESLVIHEFGHALGLEHEHQRSTFWNVFDTVVEDKDKMPGALAYHKRGNFSDSDRVYDPKSIMHYWFDIKWLKQEYRDLEEVRSNSNLSDVQKDVIRGVHTRDCNKGRLAKQPSDEDYKTLDEEYQRLVQ